MGNQSNRHYLFHENFHLKNPQDNYVVLRIEILSSKKDYLFTFSEKCRLVSRTTTPDRPTNAIRLGIAIRPFRVSAILQARLSSIVAPTKMITKKMI